MCTYILSDLEQRGNLKISKTKNYFILKNCIECGCYIIHKTEYKYYEMLVIQTDVKINPINTKKKSLASYYNKILEYH